MLSVGDSSQSPSSVENGLWGPFHRIETPTQTAEVAHLQELVGEIWGATPRDGFEPTVQAFRGPLPAGARGIEFWTYARPHAGSGPRPSWYAGREGVWVDGEFAKIRCVVTRNTQTAKAR